MTELPLRHLFGGAIAPDRFLSLAICPYGEKNFALFDQAAMTVMVIDSAGALIRKFPVSAEGVKRPENGNAGGFGHPKNTGPAITADSVGSFYVYVSAERYVRICNAQGEPVGGFEIDFPAEDVCVEPDATLIIPGFYKNFRIHRFSLKGKLLRSWLRQTPNSLLTNVTPSAHPLMRTAAGRFFFRANEQHGVIVALDSRVRQHKLLVREQSSLRRRALVQVVMTGPDHTSIAIAHSGEYGRIHALIPQGQDGVAMLVSNYFIGRRFLECYDANLVLKSVFVVPPTPNLMLHSGIQLASGMLIILMSNCNAFRVSRGELESADKAEYLRLARQDIPAIRTDILNAPEGPYLKDSALKKLQANWSLVTKGLVILIDARLDEEGRIEVAGPVQVLPWQKTSRSETIRLQERVRKLITSLAFNPRTEGGIPRSCKIQLSISLNNQAAGLK